jgi:P27 family predicted phage terminase small subunit
MKGRKPKPTALKEVAGNPGKRKLNRDEPRPELGRPSCPLHIETNATAKAEWDAIIPQLEQMGVLAKIDRAALAAYCMCYARWIQAEGEVTVRGLLVEEPIINSEGELVGTKVKKNPAVTIAKDEKSQMRAFLALFGMDPSSRSRLRVGKEGEQKDPFEEFLKASGQPQAIGPKVQ